MGLVLCAAGVWTVSGARAADNGWCPVTSEQARGGLPSVLATLRSKQDLAPSPLAHVHTEGTLPHQGVYDASMAAKKDLLVMLDAALAWRATGEANWLALAQRYLMAWVGTYRPSYNPIDETGFDTLIETYAIIKNVLPAQERSYVSQFLEDWAHGYLQSIDERNHRTIWVNNWQSHRVKLVTSMAVALDDPELFDAARQLFQRQIAANIKSDGETQDFGDRDALHYVVYDLQPLVQAALAAQRRGESWYHWRTAKGASLEKAVAWLTPYVSGEKMHEEFVHSHVSFDAIRAQAGLKGFTGLFDPHAAATLYWLASLVDPALEPLARSLSSKPPLSVSMCGL